MLRSCRTLLSPSRALVSPQRMSPHLALSRHESDLLRLLTDCASWIDSTNQLASLEHLPDTVNETRQWKDTQDTRVAQGHSRDPVVLRVAGGWVRDKLLGRPSDDIDISTSPYPLTGFAFAELLRTYCSTVMGSSDAIGKITKIDANPLQSKHLETATVTILGFSVDFVQLRGGEVYDEGSRIPNAVQFGTPISDAERRDLTINSLFYNLHTGQVEDHTARGLLDIGLLTTSTGEPSQKLIRTPLDPFQTFRDDPLRVIRAVRFASRLGGDGFVVDQELAVAVGREEIRDALRDTKRISRERVGAELYKMLKGPDPLLALVLIDALNLHPLIFLYEPADIVPAGQEAPNLSLAVVAARVLNSLLPSPQSPSLLPPLHPFLTFTVSETTVLDRTSSTVTHLSLESEVRKFYLSASLLPLYGLTTTEGKAKKPIWLGDKVVKDGIKGANYDRSWCSKARESCTALAEGVRRFAVEGEKDRVEIGMLLRNASVHDAPDQLVESRGSTWNMSLFWSLVVELTRAHGNEARSRELVEQYNAFVELIVSLSLHELAFAKPLLNGNQINVLLPATVNSPATAQVIALVIRWQMGHPGRGLEDCERWLLSEEGQREVEKIFASGPTKKPPQAKTKKRKGGQ